MLDRKSIGNVPDAGVSGGHELSWVWLSLKTKFSIEVGFWNCEKVCRNRTGLFSNERRKKHQFRDNNGENAKAQNKQKSDDETTKSR